MKTKTAKEERVQQAFFFNLLPKLSKFAAISSRSFLFMRTRFLIQMHNLDQIFLAQHHDSKPSNKLPSDHNSNDQKNLGRHHTRFWKMHAKTIRQPDHLFFQQAFNRNSNVSRPKHLIPTSQIKTNPLHSYHHSNKQET